MLAIDQQRPSEDSPTKEKPHLIHRLFCTFADCDKCDETVFKDSYIRGYKPNGLKVFRCFPHCCSQHARHGICGTSVVMQVAGNFSRDEAQSFISIGRFESCIGPSYKISDIICASDVEENPQMWFSGIPLPHDKERPLLFQYNKGHQEPWHYGWISGASTLLRTTLHVFKSYLCQANASSNDLHVLGTAQSPGFTVVPYKQLSSDIDQAEADAANVLETTGLLSCDFATCECDKPHFGEKYIRCNRANGRKQLRCFPHCCPEHQLHSSCGSPLFVRVDILKQDIPLTAILPEIYIYAHVERHQVPELSVGQVVNHSFIQDNLLHMKNERGDWIPGLLEPTRSSASSLVFKLNEHSKQLGWPYNWKGSATKADRSRKHVLKVYAFLRLPEHNQLRVLTILSSTPFTLASYRRSNATPTSRTNKYIQVKPKPVYETREKPCLTAQESRMDSPEIGNTMNSAG